MSEPAVFVVDLASCTGCYACSVACKDRLGLPDELDALHVETYEGGAYPNPTLTFRVVHCFHCAEPPCVEACPAQAVLVRDDGLVVIDGEMCTGCGACVDACPFGVVTLRPDGVAVKCDGCADEIARGWDPTCVRACPMRALQYEPLKGVQIGSRMADPTFQDLGVQPRVLYWRRW